MKRLPVSCNEGAEFPEWGSAVGRAARAGCIALAIVLSSSVASADPLRIISGFFGSGGDDTGFWAEGANFYFQTAALPQGTGPVVACSPCTPGSQISLSSVVTIGDWGAGSARLDGETFQNVYYAGTLAFGAGSVTVPDVPPQAAGLEETVIVPAFSTFTFTGTLTGFADPSRTGVPLFSADLVGGGSRPFSTFAGFGNVGSGVFLDYVDYTFNDVAPVPEPGTLLLVGCGAAWIARRSRKRGAAPPASV